MLFQIVHTHTSENCPGRSPEQMKPASAWWAAMKKAPGVKVLAGYVDPLDHTFYITVEADDYSTISRALGPLMTIGSGSVIPVITLDQTFSMAETGVFRAGK
jgi:hypothetical protein